MLYEMNGKYYVLASRKYIQVEVSEDGHGGYNVSVIDGIEPIEYRKDLNPRTVQVEEVVKKSKKTRYKDE